MNYIIDYLTNRYSKVGDANITYDQAGNLALDKDGYEYEYDYENRIVKITKDGNDIAGFAYDALGRRIEKKDLVTSANTRRYYHGGRWQVLVEYDGAGTWKDLFVYGNYIDEVLISGQGYVYAHDHLYSPVALLQSGSTGAVLERYEYDAYGSCHVLEYDYTDDPDGKSDYGNPYLFTGRRVDTLDNGSLTIQYNRNRYYDYYTGRWTTHDPKGYIDGMNLCDYVVGNPLIRTDPRGLSFLKPDPHKDDERDRQIVIERFGGFSEFEYGEGTRQLPFRNGDEALEAFRAYADEKRLEVEGKLNSRKIWHWTCKKCTKWSCKLGKERVLKQDKVSMWLWMPHRDRLLDVKRNVGNDRGHTDSFIGACTRNRYYKHWDVKIEREYLRKHRFSVPIHCTRACRSFAHSCLGGATERYRSSARKQYWVAYVRRTGTLDHEQGSYWGITCPDDVSGP